MAVILMVATISNGTSVHVTSVVFTINRNLLLLAMISENISISPACSSRNFHRIESCTSPITFGSNSYRQRNKSDKWSAFSSPEGGLMFRHCDSPHVALLHLRIFRRHGDGGIEINDRFGPINKTDGIITQVRIESQFLFMRDAGFRKF